MNRFVSLLLVLVGAVSAASAQRVVGAMPKEFLLLNPKVQAELQITKEQKSKIDEAVQDAVSDEGNGRIQIRMSPDMNLDEMVASLKKSITPSQEKRLVELWIQRDGVFALGDAGVAKTLDLTADQKKKVKAILEELGYALEDLAMSSGGRVEHTDALPYREKAKKQLDAVMSSNQQKKFSEMKGKPFKWN